MELLSGGQGIINRGGRSFVTGAAILALGLVVAASIAAYAFYRVHTLDNTLSVTGSAIVNVQADSAKWTVSVNHTATEGTIGSTEGRVSSDTQKVVNFFAAAGIPAENIVTSPVFVDQNYDNSNGTAPLTYNVHEDITIQSDTPSLVDKLSKNISQLVGQGVLVSPQAPEYYVITLPQIRVGLVGKAIIDAKARAAEIAKSTGQSVGALQSASGGVVQVMAPNSDNVTSDGSYDTSTIDKQVMVTAHATFYLR